jgi:RarD protein
VKPASVARLKALIAVIMWGGSLPSVKVAVAEVSLSTLVWLRFGSGLIALLLFLVVRRRLRILPLREAAVFAALGFLGVFFHNSIQAYALKTVSAGMSGLIVAANPIVIAVLGSLILSERLDRIKIAGILLAACGVLVIISRGDLSVLLSGNYSFSELVMVFSVFSWAFFSVLSRKALQQTSPDIGMTYALFFGWIFASVPFLVSGGTGEIAAVSAMAWGNILFLGIFCSALAYLFWYDALQLLPASEVGVFLYVNPVVAVVISAIFLGEPVTLSMIVGGALVFSGVWCVNQLSRRYAPARR